MTESFGERVKRHMDETGLTAANMMKLLNISEMKLENLLTEYTQPDIDILSRLAQIFNVGIGYMAMHTEDPAVKEDPNVKEVYVINGFSDNGSILRKDTVDTVYINRADTHGKEFYALVAKDDSMVKCRIYKGDMLIVRRQNTAENGDVIVSVLDGDYVVRRYNRRGNIVTLTAEGDTVKYKTVKIDVTEENFVVLGKVCEVRMRNI